MQKKKLKRKSIFSKFQILKLNCVGNYESNLNKKSKQWIYLTLCIITL